MEVEGNRIDVLFEIQLLIVAGGWLDIMRLDHIFNDVVEFTDSNDLVVKVLDLVDKVFHVVFDVGEDSPD